MEKKEKQLLKSLEKSNAISLKRFLISCCGIYNVDILKNKISHKDMKFLFPYIKKVSFEYVLKNTNEIYIGNIILVEDSYGNIAPYINPKIKEQSDVDINDIDFEESYKDDTFERVIELEKLSIYELSLIGKKYKEENRINEYRKICRIINKRKDKEIEIYHKKKEKIIMKGRLKNEEY